MAVYDKIGSEKEFEDSLIGQGEVLYFPSISDNKPKFIFKTSEQKYYTIKNGFTFTPFVAVNGDLSWTNDGELSNPATVNIKGDKGDNGFTFTPYVDSNGNLSWTNNGGLNNPASVNIKGDKGEDGKDGVDGTNGTDGKNGVTFTPYINDNGDLSWTNDGGLSNPQKINLKPIVGKDYFTEQDKQNIVNEVIEKLPIYVLNEKTH